MRCVMCEQWSLSHICSSCQNNFLTPQLHKRKILGTIDVYSFFDYGDIEPLLLTKHSDLGYYLYTILAHRSMKKFASAWDYSATVASIGIDDHVNHGYSHTAVLNRSLKSSFISPLYGKLRARNPYPYAGKTLEERLQHPRDFEYRPFSEEQVILVDDIVTTGTTLTQAAEVLAQHNKEVIFCLTLADADR